MKLPFMVMTDALDEAIVSIHSQEGVYRIERIIHSYGKCLEKAERNYSTTDKKLLSILKTLLFSKVSYRSEIYAENWSLSTSVSVEDRENRS